ncbi:MAG: hypothetical protein ACI4JZ_00500 [Oscillospiraceae bacterium]
MTKRAKFLAVFLLLPIILLCGCSSEQNKRLSPEEYRSAMESAWDKYLNSMLDLIDLIPLEVNEESVKTLQENAESAEPALKMREQSLNEFKEIEPPEKYEELHKKLIAAEDAWEYEQLELYRKMFTVQSVEELTEINETFQKHTEEISGTATDFSSGTTFPAVYLQIIKELTADNVGGISLQ